MRGKNGENEGVKSEGQEGACGSIKDNGLGHASVGLVGLITRQNPPEPVRTRQNPSEPEEDGLGPCVRLVDLRNLRNLRTF